MSTRIEINLNLRIDGLYTVADLDRDVFGDRPTLLSTVEVFESTSGLVGRGWVTEIDLIDRELVLLVDWSNLTLVETLSGSNRPVTPAEPSIPNVVVSGGVWHVSLSQSANQTVESPIAVDA